MRILIDLGTSRTGVAFLGNSQEWQDRGEPVPSRLRTGTNSWGLLDQFITGCLNIRYVKKPRPHLVTYSRFAQIGSLVVPFSAADQQLPLGVTAVPDIGQPFTSIKEKDHTDYATAFLNSLGRMVRAYDDGGAQWVIGRSVGGFDPRRIAGGLPASILAYNEAVAVIFALASLDVGKLSSIYADRFVLLADLGGGFLDISVADDLKFEENSGNATIVNYGGYPLGVDRVAQRFSQTPVPGPDKLIDFIALCIRYHLWDYYQQAGAKKHGLIVLAGGGFERFGRQLAEQRIKREVQKEVQPPGSVGIHFADHDTKFLTLVGLGRMAELAPDEGGGGDDISYRNPLYHGKHLNPKPSGDQTWYALIENLRNSAY